MFDVNQFYQQARGGQSVDADEVIRYIASFQNVILWGAGNLGTAVGKILQAHHAPITEYWDMKAEEIKECNGISVKAPFYHPYDADKTLIISCIVNGSLGDQWTAGLIRQNGYSNYLLGMELYEGLGCPLKDCYFNIRVCTETKACSLCNCARYTNLIQKHVERGNGGLTFQLLTFILSTKCTLSCKYCGQRITEYPAEARKNYDKDAILRDIDHVLGAVDFIGMISLIGGEPFLHPDLNEIVEHLLQKDNFGVVNITTNGIFKVPEDTIRRLRHARVKVSFSIYDQFLTDAQKRLLEKNIELVKNMGVIHSLSHPLWTKPQEIKDYHYDETYMINVRKKCVSPKMGVAVRDGKFISCFAIENISGLGPYDISEDLVDVTVKEGLRERLLENRSKPFYCACRYCGHEPAAEIPAGEQI